VLTQEPARFRIYLGTGAGGWSRQNINSETWILVSDSTSHFLSSILWVLGRGRRGKTVSRYEKYSGVATLGMKDFVAGQIGIARHKHWISGPLPSETEQLA
jgi:hypothetical protein